MNTPPSTDPTDREPIILWYSLYKGELCRIREQPATGLLCEVWREAVWVAGPDFSTVEFTGRMISEAEARTWIRLHFRTKTVRSGGGGKSPGTVQK